jgi:hypothetical protein
MLLTGAEIVIRCLQEEKVEYVFGYPGGAVLPVYDAIFKQNRLRHILVRHEQADGRLWRHSRRLRTPAAYATLSRFRRGCQHGQRAANTPTAAAIISATTT